MLPLVLYFNAIRTSDRIVSDFGDFDFNSIKVRLEPTYPIDSELILNGFQFHKGAIRTSERSEVHRIHPHFNSIKVRLEHFI